MRPATFRERTPKKRKQYVLLLMGCAVCNLVAGLLFYPGLAAVASLSAATLFLLAVIWELLRPSRLQ